MKHLSRGNVLIGVAILSLVILMAITGFHLFQRENAHGSVRSVGKSEASRLADEALAKVEIILRTFKSTYTEASWGNIQPGFNDDVEHTDLPGGVYKVRFSPGPDVGQVTVRVKARETLGRETRTVEAVFSRTTIPYAWSGYYLGCCADVHWGAAMQDSDWNDPATRLDAQQLAARHPRKFSTTAITGLDTNPAAPNTNGQDYWAYASVRKGVTPDHSYYKNRALKSSLPMQTANGEVMRGDPVVGPAFATPAGSGHFIESSFYPRLVFRRKAAAPAGTGYSFRSSTSVVFIEADVNLFNSAVWIQPYSFLQVEALIHNSGYGIEMWLEGPGGGSIQAKIPKEASLEYQHPNAKTIWESGSPSMKDIWQRSDRCCYTLNGVSFAGLYDYEGYLRFGGTADPVLYGAFNYGESLIPMVSGRRVKIYFDEEVRRGFQPSSNYANVTRDTWSEVVAPW